MIWRVLWTPRALKDLRKLDPQAQARVVTAVDRYAETRVGDVLRLTDVEPPEWRLRIGDWRVRFRKDADRAILVILRVLPRDKAY